MPLFLRFIEADRNKMDNNLPESLTFWPLISQDSKEAMLEVRRREPGKFSNERVYDDREALR